MSEGYSKNDFVKLSKTAKGQALVELIRVALEFPGLYTFTEIAESPNVQQLAGSPLQPYQDLLQIFSYGTIADYKERQSNLPQLTPKQLRKLRHLSIVSLASRSKEIKYETLMSLLEISDIRELEDVVIDSIYEGAIRGRLDQKKAVLEIEFFIGRDLRPQQIDEMIETLQKWSEHSENLLKVLNERIEYAKRQKIQDQQQMDEFKTKFEEAKSKASSNDKGREFMSAEYASEDRRKKSVKMSSK